MNVQKSDLAYERMFRKHKADERYFTEWLALQDQLVADGDEAAYHRAHQKLLMDAVRREQQARATRR